MSDSDPAGPPDGGDDGTDSRGSGAWSDLGAAEAEPTEDDPEDAFPDPERELVSVPEAPSVPSESDVPSELRRAFWELVVVFNVALLALSVGAMLVAFERLWTVGGALVLLGAASFLRGYRRYQRVTGEEFATDGAADEDGPVRRDSDNPK